jgi:hypothetical protein
VDGEGESGPRGGAAAWVSLTRAMKRYPRPWTVSINVGTRASSARAWRSSRIAVVSTASVTAVSGQAPARRSAFVTSCPGRLTSN